MTAITISYPASGRKTSIEIEAPTLVAAIEKFHILKAYPKGPYEARIGTLTLWTSTHGDFDVIDLTYPSRPRGTPAAPLVPNAIEVAEFLWSSPSPIAHWLFRGTALRPRRAAAPIAWTSTRVLMHLEEAGIIERTQNAWGASASSAHQRLARHGSLAADLEAMRRRDVAIRGRT
jgi:hypothetical protein